MSGGWAGGPVIPHNNSGAPFIASLPHAMSGYSQSEPSSFRNPNPIDHPPTHRDNTAMNGAPNVVGSTRSAGSASPDDSDACAKCSRYPSKPGSAFVLFVFRAESLGQHLFLAADAHSLHGNQYEEKQQ